MRTTKIIIMTEADQLRRNQIAEELARQNYQKKHKRSVDKTALI